MHWVPKKGDGGDDGGVKVVVVAVVAVAVAVVMVVEMKVVIAVAVAVVVVGDGGGDDGRGCGDSSDGSNAVVVMVVIRDKFVSSMPNASKIQLQLCFEEVALMLTKLTYSTARTDQKEAGKLGMLEDRMNESARERSACFCSC